MERESDLISCTNCPEEPGRFCTPYKGGKARLVFRPSLTSAGPRYREGYSSPGSISACPVRQKVVKDSGIKLK